MEKPNKQYVSREGSFAAKVKKPGNGWLGFTASGKDFVRVPVVVTDPGDQQGAEAVWTGYLTESAVERTMKVLNDVFGLGWNMTALDAQTVDWEGRDCRVTVGAEEYNGETRYKIKWLNPATGTAVAMEEDRLKALEAKLREVRGGTAEKVIKAVVVDEVFTDADGDEIPF